MRLEADESFGFRQFCQALMGGPVYKHQLREYYAILMDPKRSKEMINQYLVRNNLIYDRDFRKRLEHG